MDKKRRNEHTFGKRNKHQEYKMKSTNNRRQVLMMILILGMIGLLLWYAAFYLNNTDILTDATLVII